MSALCQKRTFIRYGVNMLKMVLRRMSKTPTINKTAPEAR
jgi:hypothetical protein